MHLTAGEAELGFVFTAGNTPVRCIVHVLGGQDITLKVRDGGVDSQPSRTGKSYGLQ